MSEATPATMPTAANRLTIAHLMLWTAMTAIVLGFIRHIAPHYTPTSAATPQFALNLWLQYLLLFAVSPAYGAALAGLQLAIWRLLTRRFGFPSQPGHWLLLVLAIIPIYVVATWLLLPSFDDVSLVFVCIGLVVATLLSLAAAMRIRRPTWWLPTFALAAGGLGGIALSVATWIAMGFETPPVAAFPAVLGALAVAGSIMAGLAAGILDLTAPERYDVFHWTGVATLAAFAAYPLLAWLIVESTIG